MDECLLCGAPGGYPYCNDACRDADDPDDEPFTPTAADMESEHYGLLVSSLGDDSAEGYVAVGRDVTPRRALAALSAYARHTDPDELPARIRDELRDRELQVLVHPTAFTRHTDESWDAERQTGGQPTAWIVSPWHPAHSL